ncbi:MAG: hypothetical protein Q9215_004310 [Flavoplaca cf. flavocitrina]
MISMCERAADPDEKDFCALCGQEMNLLALRLHVASHLEDVSLFVLTGGSDEDDTDASSTSSAEVPRHIPSDLSCLVLYEPLRPDYTKQPIRIGTDGGNRFWAPPNRKDAYLRDAANARLFRWIGGRMTDISAESTIPAKRSLYSVATVFTQWPDTPHILAVTFDAEKKDVAEECGGWKVLSFDYVHQPEPQQLYSSVSVTGSQQRLAGPGSGINLILDVSSDPRLTPVLASLIFGEDQAERGMVVSVFLDPDNKWSSTEELLDRVQNGYYGAFYGS